MISVMLALAAAATPSANYLSGGNLLEICNPASDPSGEKLALCTGYIAGVADANTAFGDILKQPLFCMPNEVLMPQLKDVVTKYLVQHPEKSRLAAATVVGSALINTYPCPK
jgi:hypothetical protein